MHILFTVFQVKWESAPLCYQHSLKIIVFFTKSTFFSSLYALDMEVGFQIVFFSTRIANKYVMQETIWDARSSQSHFDNQT